jgi:hypothetical protein
MPLSRRRFQRALIQGTASLAVSSLAVSQVPLNCSAAEVGPLETFGSV